MECSSESGADFWITSKVSLTFLETSSPVSSGSRVRSTEPKLARIPGASSAGRVWQRIRVLDSPRLREAELPPGLRPAGEPALAPAHVQDVQEPRGRGARQGTVDDAGGPGDAAAPRTGKEPV